MRQNKFFAGHLLQSCLCLGTVLMNLSETNSEFIKLGGGGGGDDAKNKNCHVLF